MGRKKGMTQIFGDNGNQIPVTVIEVGPCTVTQKRTTESDGYNALQLGFGITKPKRMSKPRRGHLEKKGLPLFTWLKEFRTDNVGNFEAGDELWVGGFKAGDKVHVRGLSKGRGFQGVIKRHGKHGGPASHGSHLHRRPGSIGMRTSPARVFKNTRLPGHMGDEAVCVKNLEVVAVRTDENILLLRGAVPGSKEGFLTITPSDVEFETRPELKSSGRAAPEEAEASEGTAEAAPSEERPEEKKTEAAEPVKEEKPAQEAPKKETKE